MNDNERREQLRKIFPEAFCDGRVDFDVLKRALGETAGEGMDFELQWPGKFDCLDAARRPASGMLLPLHDASVDFDATEHLVIEGDNLDVLKLLQRNYRGRVKMIYIDPPYNTGNSFVYADDFRVAARKASDGLRHGKWLSMMYPRLLLARTLLREDGVMFVSIDDHEAHHLRALMDEVFGEENFIAQICCKARASVSNDKIVSSNHHYLLLFARSFSHVHQQRNLFGLPAGLEGFDHADEHGRYKLVPVTGPRGAAKGNPFYEFLGVQGHFRYSEQTMRKKYDEGRIVKVGASLRQKYYWREAQHRRKTVTTWWDGKFYTSTATAELRALLGGHYFDHPKPVTLIKHLLELWVRDDGDIVLDFFAGSGTTAHAVMEMNLQDQCRRQVILVQLGEPTPHADYPTIADITRERVRRVSAKLKAAHADLAKAGDAAMNPPLDFGFKALRHVSIAEDEADRSAPDTPHTVMQEKAVYRISGCADCVMVV